MWFDVENSKLQEKQFNDTELYFLLLVPWSILAKDW